MMNILDELSNLSDFHELRKGITKHLFLESRA